MNSKTPELAFSEDLERFEGEIMELKEIEESKHNLDIESQDQEEESRGWFSSLATWKKVVVIVGGVVLGIGLVFGVTAGAVIASQMGTANRDNGEVSPLPPVSIDPSPPVLTSPTTKTSLKIQPTKTTTVSTASSVTESTTEVVTESPINTGVPSSGQLTTTSSLYVTSSAVSPSPTPVVIPYTDHPQCGVEGYEPSEAVAGCVGNLPTSDEQTTWPIAKNSTETVSFYARNSDAVEILQDVDCSKSIVENLKAEPRISFQRVANLGNVDSILYAETIIGNDCAAYYAGLIIGGPCITKDSSTTPEEKLDCETNHPGVPDEIVQDAQTAKVLRSFNSHETFGTHIAVSYTHLTLPTNREV